MFLRNQTLDEMNYELYNTEINNTIKKMHSID